MGPTGGSQVPEVDVVLPTNRHSPFLEEALASVGAQEGVVCNIVVVDDGSHHAADIRTALANVPNATVLRQEAAGISAARNRGLKEGRADFVAFLDDDDFWDPSKSLKQITALNAAPQAVACCCDGWYVNVDGDRLGTWTPVGAHPSRDYLSGDVELPRIPTLLYRRSVCDQIDGFDESVVLVEDQDFALRALMHGTCAVVPEKLVYYRMHDANVSFSPGSETRNRYELNRTFKKLIAMCDAQAEYENAGLLRLNYARRRDGWCLRSLRQVGWATRTRSVPVLLEETRWLVTHGAWLVAAAPTVIHHLRDRQLTSGTGP